MGEWESGVCVCDRVNITVKEFAGPYGVCKTKQNETTATTIIIRDKKMPMSETILYY